MLSYARFQNPTPSVASAATLGCHFAIALSKRTVNWT